jgi:hypothetical protein
MTDPAYTKGNRLLTRVMDPTGIGQGDPQILGDYSDEGLGATEFILRPIDEDSELQITSGTYFWEQEGPRIHPQGYGTSPDPLINGIQAFTRHDGVITTHFMAGGEVTINAAWGVNAAQMFFLDAGLPPPADLKSSFIVTFDFVKTWGHPIILDDGLDELVFVFNDDFSDFSRHLLIMSGWDRRKKPVV